MSKFDFKATLCEPFQDEHLYQLVSSLQARGQEAYIGTDAGMASIRSPPTSPFSTIEFTESASEITESVKILSKSKLPIKSLEIKSHDGWFGIQASPPNVPEPTLDNVLEPTLDNALEPTLDNALEPTLDNALEPTLDNALKLTLDNALKLTLDNALKLTLDNVWIVSRSLMGLVELHLNCNLPLKSGPVAAEWLLTLLNGAANLEVCTLHLEPAAMASSFAWSNTPKVNLEKIKKFDVSHHWVQIRTLFSSLTLPETAKVNISTTVTKSDPDNTLDQVVFPPNWPTNKQAWEQGKLKLDLSLDAVEYRIGVNHTVTVKHGKGEDARTLSPSVVSGHGNPEGKVTDLEVSFCDGVEGVNSVLWDIIFHSNTKLVNLTCSNIKIQDLCGSLNRTEVYDGVEYAKCPQLSRLVLRNVKDSTVQGAIDEYKYMLKYRRPRPTCDCPELMDLQDSGESSDELEYASDD